MRILKANQDLPNIERFSFEKGKSYVFWPFTAEQIKTQANQAAPGSLTDDEDLKFEDIYKEYDGEPLDNKKILFWTFAGMDDMLFMSPVIKRLKKLYPTCHISLACDSTYHPPMTGHVDKLLALPIDAAWLRGADYSIYFETPSYDFTSPADVTPTDVFLEKIGLEDTPSEEKTPSVAYDYDFVRKTDKLFKDAKIEPDDFIVGIQAVIDVQPKDFPFGKLVQVAKDLITKHNAKIVWLAKDIHKDRINVHAIKRNNLEANSLNMSGECPDFATYVAVAAKCDVVIAADCSALYLSVADKTVIKKDGDRYISKYENRSQTPIVGLFGPTLATQRITDYKDAVGITAQAACMGCNIQTMEECRYGYPSPCFEKITSKNVFETTMRLMANISKKEIKDVTDHVVSMADWEKANEELHSSHWGPHKKTKAQLQEEKAVADAEKVTG